VSFAQEFESQAIITPSAHPSPGIQAPSGPDQTNRQPVASKASGEVADRVLRSFNTWAFKREQPSDLPLMRQFIAEAVARSEPVPFVLYWGKGPRHHAAAPDVTCLDYIATLMSRIKKAYAAGAAVKLILTDTHAGLNGHSREEIGRYFADIEDIARQRGIGACLMSGLVAAGGAGIAAGATEEPSADMHGRLVASAVKWYRGAGGADDGARRYFRMNMIERRAVAAAFPRAIFITFNGHELRGLFPHELPIFYMYALRRGVGTKPWFLTTDAVLSEDTAVCAPALPRAAE
jgi:L-tyrosine isonitrile synthase